MGPESNSNVVYLAVKPEQGINDGYFIQIVLLTRTNYMRNKIKTCNLEPKN